MPRYRQAAGQKDFRGDQPPTDGPTNKYPGSSDPGITAKSDLDFAGVAGRIHKSPNDPGSDTKLDLSNDPEVGKGTGNRY